MDQKNTRYHSAFIELAKGSEIRPLRSRRGTVLALSVILALVAFAVLSSGWVTPPKLIGLRFPATQEPRISVASPEAVAPTDLSPEMIEAMQESLHDRASDPRSSP